MRLSDAEISGLIKDYPNETSWLDFKESYYAQGKGADLVHDLLCMANLVRNGPRFIIFGISDQAEIVGVEESVRIENIQSVLRSAVVNSIPEFSIYDVQIDGRIVSVWQIENLAKKPYILLKDYEKQGKRVRAGVIYSRYGPTNTPIDGCAHEAEVIEMWRERLLLTQPPKHRAEALLRQVDRWVHSSVIEGGEPLVWYHFDHPEYTIELRYRRYEDFYEPWIARKKLKELPRDFGGWSYRVNYLSTALLSGVFFVPRHCKLPFPRVISPQEYRKEPKDMRYILRSSTDDFFVGSICNSERGEIDSEVSASEKLTEYYDSIVEDVMVMFGLDVFEIEKPA